MTKRLFLPLMVCLMTISFQFASGETPKDKAQEVLVKGLSESNPIKRKEAVIALSLEGATVEVLQQLETALSDKDVDVQMAACASLAEMKGKRATDLLLKALNQEIPEVSFAAAKALYDLGHPAGKEVMLDILGGERKTSSSYLTQQKRDALQLMKNPPALFRMAIKEGVGMIPIPGAGFGAASLEGILKDQGVNGRALAATMLARENDQATFTALREALTDKSWSVRAAAIHALALRNRAEVSEHLIPLLDDKNDAVKFRAAATYLRLQNPAVIRNGATTKNKTLQRKKSSR